VIKEVRKLVKIRWSYCHEFGGWTSNCIMQTCIL